MCGFLFAHRKHGKVDLEFLNRLGKSLCQNESLRHRGPDSANYKVFGSTLLVGWRLAIVDQHDRSDQPYMNADSDAILCFNGEIFDFEEQARIRNLRVFGDTQYVYEVLRAGQTIDNNHIGFYSYVFFDVERNKVSIGRDSVGKKPLLYFEDSEWLIFASEESTIMTFVNLSICDESLLGYAALKDFYFGKTAFSNLYYLPPGVQLTLDLNSTHSQIDIHDLWSRFYSSTHTENLQVPMNGCELDENELNRLEKIMDEAIKIRVNGLERICVAISGGVDSNLLTERLFAIKESDQMIDFLFLNVKSDLHSEKKLLPTTLKRRGHLRVIDCGPAEFFLELKSAISNAGSPLSHPSSIGHQLLSKNAHSMGHKVMLMGEGADDLFMGYDHYRDNNSAGFAFRPFLGLKNPYLYFSSDEKTIISKLRLRSVASRELKRDTEMKTHLLSLLIRNDRMSMAHSIELRLPYLDRTIREFAFQLSGASCVQNELTKIPIRKLLERHSKNYLRPKLGFIFPLEEFRLKSKDMYYDYIQEGLAFLRENYEFGQENFESNKANSLNLNLYWIALNIGLFRSLFGT